MLATEGLCKDYRHPVVKDLNLHVRPGEIYGFLGPNGAGKSTTILMILGIVRPTRGTIRIFGRQLRDDSFGIKRRIGVVAETQSFYGDMTAVEYLRFFAELYGVGRAERRIHALLERFDLGASGGMQLKKYSRGMGQKLALAKALVHDPDLLILDEPVSSLDPTGIRQVREIIMEENARGKTFFISSHLLSEAERTCHRVGIIDRGQLVAEDTMEGLRRKLGDACIEVELEAAPEGLVAAARNLPFVAAAELRDRTLIIHARGGEDHRPAIARLLAARGCVTVGMRRTELSLEEVFVALTQPGPRGGSSHANGFS